MNITFFFRKSSPSYHSIEKLFTSVIEKLPKEIVSCHNAPYSSKGLINRILIGINANKHQGDINHITGDIHFIAIFLKRKKTILTIHDLGILKHGNFLKRFLLRIIWFDLPLRCVKLVTVISEFTKQELIKDLGVKEDKIIVINNCIPDIYQFIPKSNQSEKSVILQIGTKTNKNLERLVAAIEGINCKLIIVGQLSEKQIIILKESGIDYENHFNISEQEMLNLFVRSDILAYISTYEGFGMPVIEANAVGRPVLASSIEPVRTVAGNAALLVNPLDVNDISNGILKLLGDQILCNELIQNGLRNASKYRASSIAEEYMAVYQKMIEKK